MKRIKGEVVIAMAVFLLLTAFGVIEAEAVHDCANAALVKSASCK